MPNWDEQEFITVSTITLMYECWKVPASFPIFQTKHNNYDCSQCPGVSTQDFIDLLKKNLKNLESWVVSSFWKSNDCFTNASLD